MGSGAPGSNQVASVRNYNVTVCARRLRPPTLPSHDEFTVGLGYPRFKFCWRKRPLSALSCR